MNTRSFVVLLAMILFVCISLTAASDHRCTHMKTKIQTKTRTVMIPVNESYRMPCGQRMPCMRTRTVLRPRIETYREVVEVPERVCCSGYAEKYVLFGGCVAQCPNHDGCKHGQCIEPNVCVCNDGYELNSLGRCVQKCEPCLDGGNECECVYKPENGCQPLNSRALLISSFILILMNIVCTKELF